MHSSGNEKTVLFVYIWRLQCCGACGYKKAYDTRPINSRPRIKQLQIVAVTEPEFKSRQDLSAGRQNAIGHRVALIC
jgi:hypothetical protein